MKLSDGMRMRLARMGKGMSLTKLSEETNRSISFLSKMENDHVPVTDEVWTALGIENGKKPIWYCEIINAVSKTCTDPEAVIESLNKALVVRASQGP